MYNLLADKETESFAKAINALFTSEERDIIFRKLRGEPLSKTDREVYSRIVKKRLIAITNRTLSRIAQVLIYG